MAPRTRSRYAFCYGITDDQGRQYLTDREPFRYAVFDDNRVHVCRDGDTLQGIASTYFAPLPDAPLLWWILADFQKSPIIDPTVKLTAGRVIDVPSVRTIVDRIFSEARRRELGL